MYLLYTSRNMKELYMRHMNSKGIQAYQFFDTSESAGEC